MSEHDFDVSQVSNSTEYFNPYLKSILSIGLTIIKIEHFKITYWNIYVDKKLSKSFQNAKNIAQEPQNGKIINSNIVNVEVLRFDSSKYFILKGLRFAINAAKWHEWPCIQFIMHSSVSHFCLNSFTIIIVFEWNTLCTCKNYYLCKTLHSIWITMWLFLWKFCIILWNYLAPFGDFVLNSLRPIEVTIYRWHKFVRDDEEH